MRNRFGLAVLPDSSIGGRSVFEADRAARADPGSSGEAGQPCRLHQDGKQPRAPFESPLGGEGNRLSRSSSVSAGGNGPTHRFAQPRRTPLARSRSEKRRRDAARTYATARFFFLFLSPGLSLPLPPCSLILSPSPGPCSFRYGSAREFSLGERAGIRGGTERRRGWSLVKRTWGADKVREVSGVSRGSRPEAERRSFEGEQGDITRSKPVDAPRLVPRDAQGTWDETRRIYVLVRVSSFYEKYDRISRFEMIFFTSLPTFLT